MSMTRKDYEIIAAGIKEQVDFIKSAADFATNPDAIKAAKATVENTAGNIAFKLGQQNPRFNRDTFLTACGIEVAP